MSHPLQPQFFQIRVHLILDRRQFGFNLLNFGFHRLQVDFRFLLKRVNIARNVQVAVVFLNFLRRCEVGLFFDFFAFLVSVENLGDMFRRKRVLILARDKFLAGVNK